MEPVQPQGTPSPSATSGRPALSVTINFSGDLLWHNTLWESARIDGRGPMDFGPQLAGLTDYVSAADVAICHSEVPFAVEGGPYASYPMFKAPPEIAATLPAIGWDVCTTASNHSLDDGFAGLERTIAEHAAHGILTSGTYATSQARNTPVIFTTASGVRVGVVSSTYGTNGIPLPKGKPWSVSLMDADDALAQAARARAAGADIVVVHMHAGTEYEADPNPEQVAFAEAMTASPDVDLVIGQHAHVVQPIVRMNGKWVAYGAGNLMAQSGPAQPWTYDGYLATFTFVERADGSFASSAAEFAPTMITKHRSAAPARVHIVSDALAAGLGDAKALRESAARTRATVLSVGAEGLTER
ncbi:CapA family protein [Tessaracoccus sp. OS52]|uniref:CapA family protein n=1 Tax=Tessaracoccus sp. OS52 TaxID=2886691 RepID=UPI001D0FC30F|nr:CapA family protein [Tessaracoccus sp. OS52]